MADTPKKRSTYNPGTDFDFPEAIMDRKKYGYRWVANERFAQNSDGYESRGWVPVKDAEGKTIRRGDCVLAHMPIDQFEAMIEYKDNIRQEQTKLFFENEEASNASLEHEFKKKGGRTKFTYTQEN